MTDPYCVRTTKQPIIGRGLGHVTKFRNIGTTYNFGTNRDICFKFGTGIDDWPLLRPDHKTTPNWGHVTKFRNFGTLKLLNEWRYPLQIWQSHRGRTPTAYGSYGSRDQISKFWNPSYNFGTNRDIYFKYGIDIDDEPLLRPDNEMNPKWAWPGSRDRILHSKDELLTSQLMVRQR